MQVLGKTTGGVIVEMDMEEVAQIQGYSSNYDGKFQEPRVGWEYKVSDAWNLLRDIRVNREELVRIALSLRAYADLLTWKESEIKEKIYKEGEA